jgi:hypothetical protein
VSGTWETNAMSWLSQYQSEVILFIGLTLLLCGMAMGARYLWLRYKDARYWLYKRLFRNPWQWLSRPIRRLHRRWSERNLRAKMAKFEERIIADKILDVLYDEVEAGRISKGRFRRLQTEMGEFFGIPDLCRRKLHPEAIKAMRAKEKLAGPKGKIPGGKPGENVVPIYKGLGHKYLKTKGVA